MTFEPRFLLLFSVVQMARLFVRLSERACNESDEGEMEAKETVSSGLTVGYSSILAQVTSYRYSRTPWERVTGKAFHAL